MLACRANAHEAVHEAILERCETIEREVLEPYKAAMANAGQSLSATQTGAAARQQALDKAKAEKSTMDSVFVSALLLWESAFAADPVSNTKQQLSKHGYSLRFDLISAHPLFAPLLRLGFGREPSEHAESARLVHLRMRYAVRDDASVTVDGQNHTQQPSERATNCFG